MNNAEDLTKAMDMAKESVGSVDEEVAVVMESFEKRVEVMKNAWGSLANTTLDSSIVKGVVDLATNIIKLTEACGGLIPVLVGVTTAVVGLNTVQKLLVFGESVGGIKSLSDAMVAYTMMTEGATVATVGLSLAQKLLIGGAIVAGVMAICGAIKYVATASERAREKVNGLAQELQDLKDKKQNLEALANEFETLSKKAEKGIINSEESERLLEVQQEIKNIQPEISGYYDEQGNFIITQVSSAKELLDIQEQQLEVIRKQLAEESRKTIKDSIKDYEEQKNQLSEIAKYQEEISRYKELQAQMKMSDKGLDSNQILELNELTQSLFAKGIDVANIDKVVEDIKEEMSTSLSDMQNDIINVISGDSIWDTFDTQARNNIRKKLSEISEEDLVGLAEKLKNGLASGELSVYSFIQSLEQIPSKVQETEKEIESVSDSTEEYTQQLSSIGVVAEQVANDMDILKVSMSELQASGDISENTMKKLLSKYPELASKIKDTTSAYVALSQKMREQSFDNVTNQIADLTGVLEDLEAGNGITASSFKKLSSNFPELLGYMSDETTLTDAINSKMEELKKTQNDTYKEMVANSEEYYRKEVLQNEQTYSTLMKNLQDLFNKYGVAYQGDLNNYTSMEQAKAKATEELINQLGKAWQQYFDSFGQIKTEYSFDTFKEKANSTPQGKLASQLAGMNSYSEKQRNDNLKSAYDMVIGNKVEEARQQMNNYYSAINDMNKVFQDIKDSFHFEPVSLNVGGSKSSGGSKSGSEKYPSYISSLYDEIIDSIMEGQEKLERAITNTNSKIELAQIQGNDGVSAFINNISKVRDELEELSKVGNVDFTVRPKVDSSAMQQASWNFEDGGYATTFTQGEFLWQGDEENGQYVYVHYTPILPDGTVLTSNELDNYLHNTLEHSQNILDNDNLKIVMKVDETSLSEEEIKNFLNTGAMTSQVENFIKECSKWDDMVHTAQEQFYEGTVDLSREGIQALIETGKIGVDSEIALRNQQEQLYKQRVDSLKKATEDIIEVRRKAVQELNSKGYAELKNLDLTNLTELELEKALREIEIQIDKANTSDNAKLKANLDYKKSLISDLGNSIIKANEQINQLASDTLTANKDLMSIQSENLDRVFDIKISALEREEKILDIRKSMLVEDGGEYDKAEKDSTKILQLNQRTLDILASKRKACEEQIREYRKLGYDDESEKIQGLIDKWASYEQARLAMVKQIAETERQNKIDATQKQLDDLNKSKGYMKDLLSLTINMLKKETEEKKNALKEQYDNKKEALKDEYEAEKDALKKKLDLLKEEADARKKALDKEKDEKDYNKEITEKQREISKIKQQITELSLDDSMSSKKKKNQLEEELRQKQLELDEIQYNHSVDVQKEAIDEELELQEDKINKQLEALEDQHKKELEAEEAKYKAELKIYEDFLNNQSRLKEEASRLIESKEQGFYERLKTYAMDYTDTTQAEFENCWNKAYEALEKYGAKQGDVLATIEQMTQSIITLTDEMERLNETTYKDFINDDPNTNNDDYKFAGDSVSSSNKTNSSEKYGGLVDKSAKEKFRDEQLEKLISLGDQMKNADPNTIKNLKAQQAEVAKTIGAYMQGNTYYIMIDGKKYPVRNAVGIRTRHQGIETGEVGSPYGQFKLKSNEELNKLLDGEIVLNEGQVQKINDIVKSLAQNNGVGNVAQVTIDMHDFNVTEDTLPDLKKFIKEQIPKVINDKLFSKGIK